MQTNVQKKQARAVPRPRLRPRLRPRPLPLPLPLPRYPFACGLSVRPNPYVVDDRSSSVSTVDSVSLLTDSVDGNVKSPDRMSSVRIFSSFPLSLEVLSLLTSAMNPSEVAQSHPCLISCTFAKSFERTKSTSCGLSDCNAYVSRLCPSGGL